MVDVLLNKFPPNMFMLSFYILFVLKLFVGEFVYKTII